MWAVLVAAAATAAKAPNVVFILVDDVGYNVILACAVNRSSQKLVAFQVPTWVRVL
jgi:hypothetical protein